MSPRWGRILEGTAVTAFALISTIAVARVGLEPRDPSRAVGVVFSPWTDENAALTRAVGAGARFVRFGGPPFVVIVQPDVADYARRVKEAGALLLLDPQVLAACLSWTSSDQVKK
jgi:hypothetical protein